MADLPKPTVTADVGPSPDGSKQGATVWVARDGKARAWTGEGSTTTEAVVDVVKKMLDDPRTGEFMR